MIRSLKTLGLALVAVLALSAMVASAASAAPKLTPVPEEYPVTLKGEQMTTNTLALEGGRKVECTGATFAGTIASKAEAEESKLTVEPAYSGCTATILGNKDLATITLNGCDYLLTSSETTTGTIAAEGWEVTGKEVHLQCPAGASIEIHVFTTEANDLSNTPLCTYKIGAQTPTGDLDYKLTEKNAEGNGTKGGINETVTGVTTTRASGTATNCGAASQSGSLTGEVTVEGFNKAGAMLRGKFED